MLFDTASITPGMGLPEAATAILRALRDGPRQAQEIARELGVETSAAYRRLEGLLADGYVSAQEETDGPGRPKKKYALTEAGWETFPRDYARLLNALIATVATRDGAASLHDLLDRVAGTMVDEIARDPDGAARRARLVRLYNDLGFEAELVEETDGTLALTQRNCPFLQTARQDPAAICGCLDEGMMRRALRTDDVTLESTLARGDIMCRHVIRNPTNPALPIDLPDKPTTETP